jgi:ELWxxDGT repeat protein
VSKHLFFPFLLCLLLAGSTLLAQTRMVKNINPGAGNANPYGFVNVNGTVYFAADNGTQGVELWKSDGTEAGTTLVKDITPGAEHSFPSQLTNVNGTLFFAVGSSLWKSNGTAAGTTLVKSFTSISGLNNSFCNVNGVLYFSAGDAVSGQELWKSDGTAAGTTLVKDLLSGFDAFGYPAGSSPGNLFNANGVLYFTTQTGGVYRSNGTAAGTVRLTTTSAFSFANYKGQVYFLGGGLWKTDGTQDGTVRVSTLPNPSGDDSYSGGASKLVVSNNALYFYTEPMLTRMSSGGATAPPPARR